MPPGAGLLSHEGERIKSVKERAGLTNQNPR